MFAPFEPDGATVAEIKIELPTILSGLVKKEYWRCRRTPDEAMQDVIEGFIATGAVSPDFGSASGPQELFIAEGILEHLQAFKILDRAGHGEMLVLYGIFLALVAGAGLFEFVGMKADLGALIMGMMLAAHPKSSEMSKSLFNFKELLLVCFFLNIG